MLQIPAKRDLVNNDARTSTWVNQKKIYISLKFSPKMCIMLHVPEALRHTVTPGLQPSWTRKRYPMFIRNLSQNVYHVAYPRSAQAYRDPRTPTWLNQKKDIQRLTKILSQNVYYVEYPRSTLAYGDARTPTWVNEKRYSNTCQLNYIIFNVQCIIGLLVHLFIFLRKSS